MVFSSTVFLFIFLPVAFLMHTILPSIRAKNIWLVAASLVFYAYGEPLAVLLMLASTVVNYLLARLLHLPAHKLILIIAIVANIGTLVVFKYLGFFSEILASLTTLPIAVAPLRLPIGISFFTFQALSYVLDVYKGTCGVQKNYGKVLLYISFFPQLIAGPIVKYHDIELQIDSRRVTGEGCATGLRRFVCGLAKKLLVANTMAAVADAVFALEPALVNLPVAWLGGIAYTLQIYFDFSGYSDMAIGLGRIFGFDFKENFNYPLGADSMRDFWRKWHISLTTWFREYLYIPLGGNRKGPLRKDVNTMIVFCLTGLWHGANFTFVLWGVFNGIFLLLEDHNILPVQKVRFMPLRHIYTFVVATLLFAIFRADTVGQGLFMVKEMLVGYTFEAAQMTTFLRYLTPLFLFTLALAFVLCAPTARRLYQKLLGEESVLRPPARSVVSVLSYAGTLALLFICILNLSSAGYNPFIYFRF